MINFWQDLSVDLPRDRVYVPLADLQRHGLDLPSGCCSQADDAAMRALVRELAQWAAALMAEGAPLALRLPGRIGWELRLVVQGGLRILEKIARHGLRQCSHAAGAGPQGCARMLWRALRMQ